MRHIPAAAGDIHRLTPRITSDIFRQMFFLAIFTFDLLETRHYNAKAIYMPSSSLVDITLELNIKSVLLHACETRKTTNQITRRIQIFVNKYLRRIVNIKWIDTITNEELWRITEQKAIENQIKRRKWNWIGHTLRKETEAIKKTTLDWNWIGHTLRKETRAIEKTALD